MAANASWRRVHSVRSNNAQRGEESAVSLVFSQQPVVQVTNNGPSWWALLTVALIGAVASALAAFATYQATVAAERNRVASEREREDHERRLADADKHRTAQAAATARVEKVLLRLHEHVA